MNHQRTIAAASAAMVVIAAFVLYQPILHIGLLSDDYALLMWARRLELLPRDWGQIRPLPIATWWVVAHTSSQDTAASLHALNVALHGVNACLAGVIGFRVSTSRAVALLVAALFLTMPIAVEPVAWASGVFDIMLATFALALCGLATRRAQLNAVDQALSLLLTIAMLASKETGVIAAPLFLLVHWTRWGRVDRSALVVAGAQTILTVAYALTRELTGRLDHRLAPRIDVDGLGRVLSGVGRAFVVPLHRDIVLGHPLPALACAVVILTLLATWLVRSRQSPSRLRVTALAAAGTLLCVAPTIRIFGITPDLQGTRYVYLASAWWSILLALALLDGWRTQLARRIASGAAVLAVIAAAAATRAHLDPWTDARRERDRILLRLISLPVSCRQVAATPATDNVAGAYVFRNGLNEALATLGRSYEWVDETRATPECRTDLGR